jgi:hypothetical protein
VAALRCLLERRPSEAFELLNGYDAASRDALRTLLPLVALVGGEGGLEHASPQEAAALLDQLRRLEAALRPHAALTLDKLCFCRTIKGFGKFVVRPGDQAFLTAAEDRPGDHVEVYVEVRNFTSRLDGDAYWLALAGRLEIHDFNGHVIWQRDIPMRDWSHSLRTDYFINVQFHLPPGMPEGRYTLSVEVKDMLDPALASGGEPRSAKRSLDFAVGSPVRVAGP